MSRKQKSAVFADLLGVEGAEMDAQALLDLDVDSIDDIDALKAALQAAKQHLSQPSPDASTVAALSPVELGTEAGDPAASPNHGLSYAILKEMLIRERVGGCRPGLEPLSLRKVALPQGTGWLCMAVLSCMA
jgi:hypothetical protein